MSSEDRITLQLGRISFSLGTHLEALGLTPKQTAILKALLSENPSSDVQPPSEALEQERDKLLSRLHEITTELERRRRGPAAP